MSLQTLFRIQILSVRKHFLWIKPKSLIIINLLLLSIFKKPLNYTAYYIKLYKLRLTVHWCEAIKIRKWQIDRHLNLEFKTVVDRTKCLEQIDIVHWCEAIKVRKWQIDRQINFEFKTVVDRTKCLEQIKLPMLFHTCARISELPWNISTMAWIGPAKL